MNSSFRRHWPILLLIAMSVLFLADVWFAGRMLILRDFFAGDEPGRAFLGNAIRAGNFHFWAPSGQCGLPFAASPYNAAFYPLNWFFALPSIEWAARLWWTLHLAIAAIGFYQLSCHWKLATAPALLAAISFAFSTQVFIWMEGSSPFASMVWAPLALWLISRIIDNTAEINAGTPQAILKSNGGFIAALALVVALQILANGEYFYYSILLAAVYCFARWRWHQSWRICRLSLLQLGVSGFLGIALSMPQFILTMELMKFSDRAGEVDPMLAISSAHPRHWLTFLLPYLYGRPGYPDKSWAPSINELAIGHCYVGIVPLIAIGFCWLWFGGRKPSPEILERRFFVKFFTGIAITGLTMAAGKHFGLYALVHHWLPGLGHFRFASKFYFWVAFAFSILGGFGFQSLMESTSKSDTAEAARRLGVWRIIMAVFGLFIFGYLLSLLTSGFLPWLMNHPGIPSATQVQAGLADYTWAALFTLTGLGLFSAVSLWKKTGRWFQAGVVALAFLNLCIVTRQIQPTGPSGIYAKQPLELLKHIGTGFPYRCLSNYLNVQQYLYGETRPEILDWAREVAATNHAWLAGVSTLTPGGMGLSRYNRLFSVLSSAPPALQNKIADMMSLRYVIGGAPFDQILWNNASREIQISKRESCLPRANLVSRWRVIKGELPVLQSIAGEDFDPRKEAILEPLENEIIPVQNNTTDRDDSGEIITFKDQNDSVLIEVTTKNRSLLVLGDSWYPGWKVLVDGIKQPVFQANFLFRGVFLEPGTHHVKFFFQPSRFKTGLMVCAAAAMCCLGLLGYCLLNLPGMPNETASTEVLARSRKRQNIGKNRAKR